MFPRLRSFLTTLSQPRRFDAGLDEEVRFHLEAETDRLIRTGLAPPEASGRAKLHFGSITTMKEPVLAGPRLGRYQRIATALSATSRERARSTRDMTKSTRDMTNCRATFTGSLGRLTKAAAAMAALALLASPTVASVDDEAERLDTGIVVHPRLRLSAAPLRQHPHDSLRRPAEPGSSQDLRSASLQFARRLWLMAS